jgi:O-antigen ligase
VIRRFGARASDWLRTWPALEAPIAIDAAVLVGFVLARSIGGSVAEGLWLVAAMAAAVRWPGSGLGIAIAAALWPHHSRWGMTPAVAVVAASAIGFSLHWVFDRGRQLVVTMPIRVVVAGAVALGAATFLALTHTQRAFGPDLGTAATLRWTEAAAGLGVLVLGLRSAALGSRRPVELALVAVAAAMAVAVVDQIAPGRIQATPFDWMISALDSSRATGPFLSPNRLGTVAAVAVVVGACLAWSGRGRGRWLSVAFAGLAAVTLVLSFSRGALLGLAVAGAIVIATRSRRAAVAYVGIATILALVLVPLLVMARLAGSGASLDALFENDVGRLDASLAGIRMIISRPLFGQGFDAFIALGPRYGVPDRLNTAHFELIDLWAQAGVFAAIGYLAIVFGIVRASLDRRGDAWAMAALGTIALFFVASSFNVQSPFLAVMGVVWIVASYGIASAPERRLVT